MNKRVRLESKKAIAKGLSLIELMVSLIIGLLVVGSAIAIFISNSQTYTATENVGRIQENMRTSYELIARDIREAGSSACAKGLPVANVLGNANASWWSTWSGLLGYGGAQASGVAFGTAAGTRVSGTEAIQLMSSSNSGFSILDNTGAASADFKLNTSQHDIRDGDIVMACDYTQASIFQITQASPGTNVNIVYNTGSSTSPGNCSKGLGLPTVCSAVGNSYTFAPNSTLAKLRAVQWFIGNNPNGGRSLYQAALDNTGGVVTSKAQEIAEGVETMTFTYLVNGVYKAPTAVTAAEWPEVDAVRLTLFLKGNNNIGTDGAPIQRQISSTVTLRTRNI